MDKQLIKEYIKKKLGNLEIKELYYFNDYIFITIQFDNENYRYDIHKEKINHIEKYILEAILFNYFYINTNKDLEIINIYFKNNSFNIECFLKNTPNGYIKKIIQYKNYKINDNTLKIYQDELNKIIYKFENVIGYKIWTNN